MKLACLGERIQRKEEGAREEDTRGTPDYWKLAGTTWVPAD